jgi:hypothetical protein
MFDPYHKWLGIPPQDQPPNHYRLLGIGLFESDPEVIDAAADKHMTYIRGCATGPHVAHSQKLLNEIAAARLCLLKPEKKKAYDTSLRSQAAPTDVPPNLNEEKNALQFSSQAVGHSRGKKQPWFLMSIAVAVSIAVCWIAITYTRNPAIQPMQEPKPVDQSKIALVTPTQSLTDREENKPQAGDTSAPDKPPSTKTDADATAPRKSIEVPASDLKMERVEGQLGLSEEKRKAVKTSEQVAKSVATLAEVPSDADQEKSETTIKQVLQSDYAKASRPSDKQALARKLLRKAKGTDDDPIHRFVLLREARDIATEVGAIGTAMEAIDGIARWHEVDALQMKTDALAKIVKVPRPTESMATHALTIVALLDDAIAVDQYELAKRLAPLILLVAQKSTNNEFVKIATNRAKEIEPLEIAHNEMKAASEILEANPNDPEANLIVGRFLCLAKGDWENGIAKLALSSDETLKSLASMEQETLPDSLALADGWWKYSESIEGVLRIQAQSHAAEWDRRALPNLTGINKSKVEQRIASVMSTVPVLAGIMFDNAVSGRTSPASKAALVRSMGGTPESEAAVADGLRWLSNHQFPDGAWSFFHSTHPECHGQCNQAGVMPAGGRSAATGLALLAFLGSGHTHQDGDYQDEVKNGVEFLLKNAKTQGQYMDLCPEVVANEKLYTHGLCTIALSELAALTKDSRIKSAAKSAVNFIVASQNPKSGGWRYMPYQVSKDPGDTSVVGWQIMALKSAKNAKIQFSDTSFKGAELFLNAVQELGGSQYGYDLTSKTPSPSMTAAGLLCRMYLGWDRKNKALQNGVKFLAATKPMPNNMYYNYYATQVMHHWGGEEWNEWNGIMRDQLVRAQLRVSDGHLHGSWNLADVHGDSGGRLYMTCLCVMTLEVYYRHLPIQRRDALNIER